MDRKEIKKEAEKLYKNGKTLKEISDRYEIPQGTVRRWKHEGDWDGERSGKKGERSATGGKRQREADKEFEKAIKELNENSELSEKQKLFCVYFVKSFNATKAYQKAYGCSYTAAASNTTRLMKREEIKKEINRLKNVKINKEMLTPDDIFQKYIDIAFADITDYVKIDHEQQEIKIRATSEIDGTIIAGIKQGREGIEIKLADRMKALAWLSDHMDLATEEQKARIAVLKKQAWQDTEEDETGIVEIAQVLEEENENDMDTTAATD